ncbi:mitochondrial import protein Pam17-domain-containing protein [Polychytrium aggregatum]|uniref:mitochondrial import protein Pam17-domain-containing protein n=1 Tax=Polychytrium aggregatum TaxID=110093 RepID=UPI0022FF3F9F|nr:mitochondrial import protein Pam17-domain-containing protein [Polychytrium aggregatum]KAI9193622.1 mitochondrial import protein Pam17-domain-containing protein [Polychytrium aggregatum]
MMSQLFFRCRSFAPAVSSCNPLLQLKAKALRSRAPTLALSFSSSASRSAQSAARPSSQTTIPWKQYFELRKSKSHAEIAAAAVGGSVTFFAASIYVFAIADYDPTKMIMDMDPMVTYSAGIFVATGCGIGLSLLSGGSIWRLFTNKQLLKGMDLREREFFDRIAKHRPTTQNTSLQNPMPDFYGENVKSVADYRAWLRKQRAYKLKVGIVHRPQMSSKRVQA